MSSAKAALESDTQVSSRIRVLILFRLFLHHHDAVTTIHLV